MGSELAETIVSMIAAWLWVALSGLAELWLQLGAWLLAENVRLLGSLDHASALLLVAPLYILGVLAAGRALGLLSLRARRPLGGTR